MHRKVPKLDGDESKLDGDESKEVEEEEAEKKRLEKQRTLVRRKNMAIWEMKLCLKRMNICKALHPETYTEEDLMAMFGFLVALCMVNYGPLVERKEDLTTTLEKFLLFDGKKKIQKNKKKNMYAEDVWKNLEYAMKSLQIMESLWMELKWEEGELVKKMVDEGFKLCNHLQVPPSPSQEMIEGLRGVT